MGVFRNRTDLQHLQTAAQIAGTVCDQLISAAQPGVSTIELEILANRLLQQNRSTAPFKSFHGFGHATCISLNEEVVNGPPSRERLLKDGDLVSIAIGSCYRGIHGKAARTQYLGTPTQEIVRLLTGTQDVFDAVAEASGMTCQLRELLAPVAAVAQTYQLTLMAESGGCGIGKQMHELPVIPNDPAELAEDMTLPVGSAFTLMPMMSLGESAQWTLHEDGWTQVTSDGALSAHFAETCLMTDAGIRLISRSG